MEEHGGGPWLPITSESTLRACKARADT